VRDVMRVAARAREGGARWATDMALIRVLVRNGLGRGRLAWVGGEDSPSGVIALPWCKS
jgi:hypothetical protein